MDYEENKKKMMLQQTEIKHPIKPMTLLIIPEKEKRNEKCSHIYILYSQLMFFREEFPVLLDFKISERFSNE